MIELKNVCKTLNKKTILKDLNLTVKRGESLVIIGRSGCGKSVSLKHMIGVMRPDSGTVLVDGDDITKLNSEELDKIRMKFGMLFQGAALFDSLSVLENVGFQLFECTEMSFSQIKRRVRECLRMVGLQGIENMKPAALSGGMKKRVALARAISMNPKIILFDEPTTGVDPITGDMINKLIRHLHNTLKTTSITVTHDMRSAYRIADRIAMLYEKEIIAIGTPAEIMRSENKTVKQFINGDAEGPITAGIGSRF
ncbi:MAG: ABC transporter ATP-binding protein [Candidatus Omnitrophica bacterium]|nr:ABC transporter ATP-binding protein [Candidatus Omnitrophota bacterium]